MLLVTLLHSMGNNKTETQVLMSRLTAKIPRGLKKKFQTLAIDRDITIREATAEAIELWITNSAYETKKEKALDTTTEDR